MKEWGTLMGEERERDGGEVEGGEGPTRQLVSLTRGLVSSPCVEEQA